MKRFLNKAREFSVKLAEGKSYRYELDSVSTPDQNELFIGKVGSTVKGLFVYKGTQIYCVSHDDFTYDFLSEENERLNDAFSAIEIPSGAVPLVPEED
jgi:hypothetical protein